MASYYDTAQTNSYDASDFLFSHTQIYGLDGNDRIYGNAAAQEIYGGTGNDVIWGGQFDSSVGTGTVGDPIRAITLQASGNDILFGDSGSDHLLGGDGNDILDGGSGNDNGTILQGGLYFQAGLFGGSGNDVIYGGSGNDDLFGETNDDQLLGGTGTDRLFGSSGNDTLKGGLGADALDGSTGGDKIWFDAVAEGGDTLTYFSSFDDLVFKSSGFGNLTKGALAANRFWANTTGAAHDADDRFIYDTDSFAVYYDADGTGAQAGVKMLTISTAYAMTAADFLIV